MMSAWMCPLHVDVVQRRSSRASRAQVEALVRGYLGAQAALWPGAVLGERELAGSGELAAHVQGLALCDAEHAGELRADTPLALHVHTLDGFAAQADTVADGAGEELAACEVWALPHEQFHGLWESLVFESRLKEEALRYVETAFEFEARGVDARLVAWNRVVLLHGPPGTGKTSLCRALAHKLAVRLDERFQRACLLEINAHSLFSKWFSESGKLVTKLFDRINEIVDDPRALVCVLIDEVESLAAGRRAALAGLEPSDAVRAVNALLAALDRLRRRPNALVLATSNVPGGVDVAFLDRADLKRRVGPPGERASYEILRAGVEELCARGVVARGDPLFAWRVLDAAQAARFADTEAEGHGARASLRLRAVAAAAAARAVSGRALRRLPFLARALHTPPPPAPPPSLAAYMDALLAALHQHLADTDDLTRDDPPPPHPPHPPRESAHPHPPTPTVNGF